MIQDFSFLITFAQIAGIFVGFGALISVADKNGTSAVQLGQIRAVVTIGLVVIVAALVPIGLSRYNLAGHDLWVICSLIFLLLTWAVTLYSLRLPANRQITLARARTNPLMTVFFWVMLEIPMQLPLVFTVLGLFPTFDVAFYTTALVLNIFQAAFVLAQFVYSQGHTNAP